MRERDQAFLECWKKGMTDEELTKKFNLGIEGVKALNLAKDRYFHPR